MARKRHNGTRLRMRVEGRVAQAKRRAAANATPVPSGGRVARFLRFMGSSLACTVIDQVLAGVLFLLLRKPMRGMGFLRILVGTVIARVLAVAAFVLSHSTLGVYLLHTRFGIVEPIAKVGVDATLFFLNYYLQRNWVFTTEPTISPRKALKRPRS